MNSHLAEFRLEKTVSDTFVVHGLARIDPGAAPDDGLRITFEVGKVQRPIDLGVNQDRRWLGIAVNWIEVEPVSAGV